MPSLSVVEASTLPDGLIRTTTTFAIPTLLASATRPVILMFVRRREAAARKDSSDGGGASVVVGVVVVGGVGVTLASGKRVDTWLGEFSFAASCFGTAVRTVSGAGLFSDVAVGGLDSVDVSEVDCGFVSAVD